MLQSRLRGGLGFLTHHRLVFVGLAGALAAFALVAGIWLFDYLGAKTDPAARIPYLEHVLVVPALRLPAFWFLLVMASAGVCAGVLVHQLIVRYTAPAPVHRLVGKHDDFVGHFFGVVGVVYAVVLAFVVATAWQSFDRAKDVALQEQHDAVYLFHLADGLSNGTDALELKTVVRQYAIDLHDEWLVMEQDDKLCYNTTSGDTACSALNRDVDEIADRFAKLKTPTPKDVAVYQKGMDVFFDFTRERKERRKHYDDRLLSALWISFALGAVIVLAVSYVLGSNDARTQLARTIALCGMISIMIALVMIFDHPYTGAESETYRLQHWCGALKSFNENLRSQTSFSDCGEGADLSS